MKMAPRKESGMLKPDLWFQGILLVVLAFTLELTPVCNAEELITVFRSRKIYTMDPGWPEGSAVAVQNGRIVSVGTFEDVKLSLGERQFITDETLREKVLMPGFIETHGHPLTGAIAMTRPLLSWLPVAQPYSPDVPGLTTLTEVTAKLKEYVAAETDPGKTVLVWGYNAVALTSQRTLRTPAAATAQRSRQTLIR